MNGVERYGLVAACVVAGVFLGVLLHRLAPDAWGRWLIGYACCAAASLYVIHAERRSDD